MTNKLNLTNLKKRKPAKTIPIKPRPKVIVRAKYDWPALKLEFFQSDFIDATGFLRARLGSTSGTMRRATLGWALEKRQWRMVEIQKTLQNLQADRISAIADTQAKILALAQEKIEQMRNSGNIQVKSLVKLWEMMRTESGLPKAYTHNTNDNNNIDLTQARQSLLDKVNKALPPKK